MHTLTLDVDEREYALARLPAGADVPAGLLEAAGDGLVSVTRTPQQLSVVCPATLVPAGARVENGWRALGVRGPMPFTQTGIAAALASELAAAGVALATVSTFDTEYILVPGGDLDRAVEALRGAGHVIQQPR